MAETAKLSQLQIRVSEEEKSAIRAAAERAGMDMSSYILSRALSMPEREFQESVRALKGPDAPSFALAEINSLLTRVSAAELREAVASAPPVELSPFLANYVAAMVEVACEMRALRLPAWVRSIPPLDRPVFGSTLQRLRLYLLTHSPAAFRRRNIFIDASLGDRV
ncbi:MAG TPA: DUF1778 domain-containing protein [Steroidobacteraceae bacterium]|nr:DUF1778 domain-containing protein [Steroidobacteraceae bacterium]